ncbi:growth-regulated alpha protein-like [Pantherophis guttatus]|uniref:Growth-regulated alpha protein-like n=1 Tax=Pantherophis guttatus TaxID=94885 RepID=A0A6P9CV10_PANGU|nr:growth-regulated alpha protein-like [Pantherophis guttatus]
MLKQTFLTVLVLLACWVALMEGIPSAGRERCLCKGLRNSVQKNRIVKTEYHRPSTTCSREEVIVTLRNNQRLCLNLNGDQGREIKKDILNRMKAK